MNLHGKRVLLTGATGGIGRALAKACVDAGAYVLVAGRDLGALAQLVAELEPDGRRVASVACDLAKASDRSRLCAVAANWQGGVDVLINNAGVATFALLGDLALDEIDRTLSINLTAPMDLCRLMLPHLARRPVAHIVNIGSVFGSIGFAANSAYCAAKFGMRGFSEALRRGSQIRPCVFITSRHAPPARRSIPPQSMH